jgi:hypothetical protein
MPTISTESVLVHPPAKIYQYFNDSPPIEVQVQRILTVGRRNDPAAEINLTGSGLNVLLRDGTTAVLNN